VLATGGVVTGAVGAVGEDEQATAATSHATTTDQCAARCR